MRSIFRAATLCCAVAILSTTATLLHAQDAHQSPGLYEVTTTMKWQQSPFPQGMTAPPFSGAPHTSQICLTQAQIDKYAGPPPQTRGDCQMTDVNKTATGMSGTLVCTGQMSGKGDFEAHWNPAEGKGTTKIHFTGTMSMGQRSAPIDWNLESTSVFKSPDCGSVKPIQSPGGR